MLDGIQKLLIVLRYDIYSLDSYIIVSILRNIVKNNRIDEEQIIILNATDILNKLNISISLKSQKGEKLPSLLDEDEDKFSRFILYALQEVEKSLDNSMHHMAYDIVDAIHVFPEIFISSPPRNFKEYWNIYIKPVQKKWINGLFEEVKDILLSS